jgi:hypothetical protein
LAEGFQPAVLYLAFSSSRLHRRSGFDEHMAFWSRKKPTDDLGPNGPSVTVAP